MILLSLRVACLVLLAARLAPAAENTLNETRSTLDKWVETRQLISRTRSDWQTDKEMLEQSIQLFDRELKTVQEQMSTLGTNTTQVEKERVQAESSLKSSNESLDVAKKFIADFEEKITKFVPQLPIPLQDILKPSLARIPTNSAATKMAVTERVQVAVGILNEVDKFNNGVAIFNDKRPNAKGEEVAVQCVYIGLGAAYFVNEAGDFAGVGSPGASGWEWTPKHEVASQVKEVIRIYRNEHPATFVSLPVSIK
jgi:hypothetical protein